MELGAQRWRLDRNRLIRVTRAAPAILFSPRDSLRSCPPRVLAVAREPHLHCDPSAAHNVQHLVHVLDACYQRRIGSGRGEPLEVYVCGFRRSVRSWVGPGGFACVEMRLEWERVPSAVDTRAVVSGVVVSRVVVSCVRQRPIRELESDQRIHGRSTNGWRRVPQMGGDEFHKWVAMKPLLSGRGGGPRFLPLLPLLRPFHLRRRPGDGPRTVARASPPARGARPGAPSHRSRRRSQFRRRCNRLRAAVSNGGRRDYVT